MASIDLQKRITEDRNCFEQNLCSDESLVYIGEGSVYIDNNNSIDLTLGDTYQRNDKSLKIPSEGFIIKRNSGAVVYTKEIIGLPANVMGIVVGRGSLIYQGFLISSGKINPGFVGPLMIGIFNSGDRDVRLEQGERICSCLLFSRESGIESGASEQERPFPKSEVASIFRKCLNNFHDRWPQMVAAIAAIIMVICTIINFFIMK